MLNARADPQAEDGSYYNGPLHFAAFNARLEVAKLLLSKVVDPNVANSNGKTPYQVSRDQEARDLLRKFGAKE